MRGTDTLIVDEAHERNLNIDFLLGYLRRLLPQLAGLKVISTSATIGTERFAAAFAYSRGRRSGDRGDRTHAPRRGGAVDR